MAAKKLTIQQIALSDIQIAANRRPVDMAVVRSLADSIAEIGLQTPVTLRDVDVADPETGEVENRWFLVTGLHRLEAFRLLGWPEIDAVFFDGSDIKAELWEISENLHRSELTKLEYGEQVARWIKLKSAEGLSGQVVQKVGMGRPESGVSAAARELPLDGPTEQAKRKEAERALKIASLSEDAKIVAREEGLDDNQSALLAAAKEKTPEGQVISLKNKAKAKAAKAKVVRVLDAPKSDDEVYEAQLEALQKLWNKTGDRAREDFFVWAQSEMPAVMDRRYG